MHSFETRSTPLCYNTFPLSFLLPQHWEVYHMAQELSHFWLIQDTKMLMELHGVPYQLIKHKKPDVQFLFFEVKWRYEGIPQLLAHQQVQRIPYKSLDSLVGLRIHTHKQLVFVKGSTVLIKSIVCISYPYKEYIYFLSDRGTVINIRIMQSFQLQKISRTAMLTRTFLSGRK